MTLNSIQNLKLVNNLALNNTATVRLGRLPFRFTLSGLTHYRSNAVLQDDTIADGGITDTLA